MKTFVETTFMKVVPCVLFTVCSLCFEDHGKIEIRSFCIRLGSSVSADFRLERSDGGFTETYSETMQIDDTNLTFSVQTTQTTSQSEYTTSTPGLYTEIWTVASTTTETVATSQDMLNQLGEKFPGGLIGLVGITAIVVVLLAVTVARRNRKSAPPPPTAR